MDERSNLNTQLQLIAIVLPEPLFSFVRDQQNFIAEKWDCRHALRTPPHITIIPPLAITPEEINGLQEIAGEVAAKCNSFSLAVKGYGAFKPRVIFIKPELPPGLSDLYQNWRDALMKTFPHVLGKYPDKPYHPHITLAHRDVDRKQFDEMWNLYENKKIDISIEINQFCILGHGKNGWEIEKYLHIPPVLPPYFI